MDTQKNIDDAIKNMVSFSDFFESNEEIIKTIEKKYNGELSLISATYGNCKMIKEGHRDVLLTVLIRTIISHRVYLFGNAV